MALVRMTKDERDKLYVELVGGQRQSRAEIKTLLARLNRRLEIAEVDSANFARKTSAPDLSVVIFGSNEAASMGYLHAQAKNLSHPATIAILPAHSPAAMRRVMHAGADEVLFQPLGTEDLRRIVHRIARDRRTVDHGSIYSVASLCGGVGVTTVAGSLALAMRYALNSRVAVVDLDFQNGGLDAFLHLEPDKTILGLSEREGALERSDLDAVLTTHTSGVCLLAAPRRIDDADRISDVTVAAAIELLRKSFEIVVIDCGRHVDANTIAAWERSEEVLLVLDPSAASARTGARFRETFARLGLHDIEPMMVLNKCQSRDSVMKERGPVLAAGIPFARIPRDDRMLERTQLEARDPWQIAPDSGFVRGIEDLARHLMARRKGSSASLKVVACRPTAIGPRV
jgi:pilus assembly protein CpaE